MKDDADGSRIANTKRNILMADLIIAEVMGGDGCLPLDEERSIGHWPSRELRNPEREKREEEKK